MDYQKRNKEKTMNVLTIIGTGHKGNTRAIVDLFLKEFEGSDNSFD